MILGIGIDLVEVGRMAQAMARHPERLERRLFTDGERAFCRARANSAQHFAARFAAKEAILKALRVPPGLSWHELEIVSDERGAPGFKLRGEAERAADRAGVRRVHLSLTHAGDHAIAYVIAEGA